MSRVLEVADLAAAESKIELVTRGTSLLLEVTNMAVLYPNFEGRENNGYNLDHVKSFNLVISDEELVYLNELEKQYGYKFNVRTKEVFSPVDVEKGAQQRVCHFINVKVKYDEENPQRDPRIELYTQRKGRRSRQLLTASTVSILDHTDMERWDAHLSIFRSNNKFRRNTNGEQFCTLYLNDMKAVASNREVFGGYYDDFDENDSGEITTASEVLDTQYTVNPATGE